MNHVVRALILAAGLFASAGAFAASEVRDGNAIVTALKNERYSIGTSSMDKAALFGYLSDLKDREHLSGIVLRDGGSASQRKAIGSIAKTLELKAFVEDGGDLKPIEPAG